MVDDYDVQKKLRAVRFFALRGGSFAWKDSLPLLSTILVPFLHCLYRAVWFTARASPFYFLYVFY